VAIFVVFAVAAVFHTATIPGMSLWTIALLSGSAIVTVLGFLDDVFGLPVRVRLPVHYLVAGMVVLSLWNTGLPYLGSGSGTAIAYLVAPVLVTAVVWHLNLFNFMDGIDGIAGLQAICVMAGAIVAGGLSGVEVVRYEYWLLAGATAGFLVWNWPPARVFMGDAGSGFLGFAIAAMALRSIADDELPLTSWLILTAAFNVDATITLIRRILSGQAVSEAHRDHAYQRLALRLSSHLMVSIGYVCINLVWLIPLATVAAVYEKIGVWIAVLAYSPLILVVFVIGASLPEGRQNST